ncbi:HSPB1-associated protein 1 isoform X3 [Lathamus discolor]|uniref:HSPB1-associated protein 1 isoform X3 n=1 Tax=Lathamus discolor TaxID=678569 RepID=UPI0032B85312
MRGRGGPAAASFLRRGGEEGSGAGEESRALHPWGATRAGRGTPRGSAGPSPRRDKGSGHQDRSAEAALVSLGLRDEPRLGAAVSPGSHAATAAPPSAPGRNGPGPLPGWGAVRGGGAEGSPPEPARRKSRRSMAEAESRRPAAPGENVKPFTPEKTKEIVMSLQQPAVFCNMVGDWPALQWNAKYLSAVLDGKTIQFRLGLKTMGLVPQFETRCSYVKATLEEFLAWSCGQPSCLSGPFGCYEFSKYWAYADYKYIARIFEDKPKFFQVLLVPRHWWHYVESIDPITISINSWIELDADHEARVEEAITRMLVCALKSAENPGDGDPWLNPTEVEATSHEINLQYLNKAVSAYFKCQKASESEQPCSSSSDAEQRTIASCKRKKREVGCEPEGRRLLTHEFGFSTLKAENLQKIPFGPHLIQVLPQSQETSSIGAVAVESDGRDLLHENEGGHFGKLHCTRKQLVMSNDCEMPAHQMGSDGSPNALQTALSTNDLLDCLVNPHVINLVTRLLLERTGV